MKNELLTYWQSILDFFNSISTSLISNFYNLHFELTQLCVWEVCLLFLTHSIQKFSFIFDTSTSLLQQNVKCCHNFCKYKVIFRNRHFHNLLLFYLFGMPSWEDTLKYKWLIYYRSTTSLKKRLRHRCFLVNFAKFLKTPFLIKHFWWLLLYNYRGWLLGQIFSIAC